MIKKFKYIQIFSFQILISTKNKFRFKTYLFEIENDESFVTKTFVVRDDNVVYDFVLKNRENFLNFVFEFEIFRFKFVRDKRLIKRFFNN